MRRDPDARVYLAESPSSIRLAVSREAMLEVNFAPKANLAEEAVVDVPLSRLDEPLLRTIRLFDSAKTRVVVSLRIIA